MMLEQMESSYHEGVSDSICATEHERLGFFIQATSRRDLLVTMGLGVHQPVVDGHVVRKKFELFRVIGEFIDLRGE